MDEEVRAELLERVNRQGATVGASMPDTVTVGGSELPLREFVIETRELDRIPPETEGLLTEAKRNLRAERARRYDRLESEPLDRETAERLAEEIFGIDRALNALKNVRRPRFGEESSSAAIEDHKRWLGFLQAILE